MIQRGLLDAGAEGASDEMTEDAMSKILPAEAEKKNKCDCERMQQRKAKVSRKMTNGHKGMEKVLTTKVVAVNEIVFLLACNCSRCLLWISSPGEELVNYVP